MGSSGEAECYYDIINNGCSRPSSQCETLLKSFACLRAFPQCSSSGFQMGTCSELCTQIHEQCSSDIIFLPYFPPIIATMPPIILDDDDGNNKMIEHNIIENTENNDVANTSNILSTSVYLLVLSMVITLIF